MTTHSQTDDFDIGKSIFDQLKDLPVERQQRILRWVAEGLGVAVPGIATQPLPQLPGAQGQPQPPIVTPPSIPPATDIKTFITTKSPKSDQQFAAAVAYFYRFEAPPAGRRDSITGEFLQEAARLAGRKRLSNPRGTLNNAKKAGYLDSISPGDFTINSVGENLVAMTLPSSAETAPRKRNKTIGKKAGAKTKSKTSKR